MKSSDVREALLREVLESYQKADEEQAARWRDLDTKAQATTAISSVFIAALFAFMEPSTIQAVPLGRYLASATLVILVFSVLCCLLGMRVMQITAGPMGRKTDALAAHLERIDDPEELPERFARFRHDQVRRWRQANDSAAIALESKARLVYCGQVLLLVALVIVSILVFAVVFVPAQEVLYEVRIPGLYERCSGQQQLLRGTPNGSGSTAVCAEINNGCPVEKHDSETRPSDCRRRG